jgi:hypothetical protein
MVMGDHSSGVDFTFCRSVMLRSMQARGEALMGVDSVEGWRYCCHLVLAYPHASQSPTRRNSL